jgi:hypothetical protein
MHSDVLYDLCELLSQETEEVVGQIRKAGNKMTIAQLDQIDKLTHALKSVKTTLAMVEAEEGEYGNYGGYGRRDSRGRYMGNGYSRPYMADQPERRPPNNYGSGNGSNLVNELNRVMAQETNQRKLEMYQQMLDLAQRV